MVLQGYCKVLEKDVTISATAIPVGALEDGKPQYILGRLNCPYASEYDCNANPCSVKQKYEN